MDYDFDSPVARPMVSGTGYRCVGCGYDISGSAVGGMCPECGRPVSDSVVREARTDTCGMAVTLLVMGIVSLVMCGPLGIVAVAIYPTAARQIREGGYGSSSLTMARAGLITGIIALAITALSLGFVGIVFLLGL